MIALILGRRRQGKSTLALALATCHHQTTLIYDPNSQFRAYPYTSLSDRLRVELDVSDERVLVFRPQPGRYQEDFERLSEVVWPRLSSDPLWVNYALIIDECSTLQSPASMHLDLERMLRLSPPDLSLIQTTHRLVDTHRLSRALATDLFFFQCSSGHDLALIERECESQELARAVSQLAVYEVAHYWVAKGGERKWRVWTDPEEWYLELSDVRSDVPTAGQRAGAERGETATVSVG